MTLASTPHLDDPQNDSENDFLFSSSPQHVKLCSVWEMGRLCSAMSLQQAPATNVTNDQQAGGPPEVIIRDSLSCPELEEGQGVFWSESFKCNFWYNTARTENFNALGLSSSHFLKDEQTMRLQGPKTNNSCATMELDERLRIAPLVRGCSGPFHKGVQKMAGRSACRYGSVLIVSAALAKTIWKTMFPNTAGWKDSTCHGPRISSNVSTHSLEPGPVHNDTQRVFQA
eukprot:1265209-Amphidinium_carterae.2